MAIGVQLSKDGTFLTLRGGPSVSAAEYVETMTELAYHPTMLARVRWILSDWSDTRETTVDGAAIRRVAAVFGALNTGERPPIRIAIVASTDLVYGMARMADSLRADAREGVVFRSAAEAMTWLSVPPEHQS